MLYHYQGAEPEVEKDVYIAPGCRIIGKVIIGKDSSVWPNAVLRGDIAEIKIGEETNIQDNCTLHVDRDINLTLGNRVTIGHGAILHSCEIKSDALIGMGAIILNGASIGNNVLIAAGTLIPPGKEIPDGSLVMGNPGKVVRQLKPEEKEQIMKSAQHYKQLKTTF